MNTKKIRSNRLETICNLKDCLIEGYNQKERKWQPHDTYTHKRVGVRWESTGTPSYTFNLFHLTICSGKFDNPSDQNSFGLPLTHLARHLRPYLATNQWSRRQA